MAPRLAAVSADSFMVQFCRRGKKKECQHLCISGISNAFVFVCGILLGNMASGLGSFSDNPALLFSGPISQWGGGLKGE